MRLNRCFLFSAVALAFILLPTNVFATLPDSDGDGDVDLHDVAAFANCFGTVVSPACTMFDSDADGNVNLTDWIAFSATFYGAFSPCPSNVVISPAAGSNIPASLVTVFGQVPPGASNVSVQAAVLGFPQGDSKYFAPNVGLVSGPNVLRVDGVDASENVICSRLVQVNRTGDAGPLTLLLSPQSGPPGTQVTATVETSLAIQELRFDFTGDGVTDLTTNSSHASLSFDNPGRFAVFAVAKTIDGLYFSNLLPTNYVYSSIVVIGAQPQTTATAKIDQPVDIASAPTGELFVIGADSVLTKLDASLNVFTTVTLAGLTTPAGLAISSKGEFFVADSGSHRIAKFNPDGTPTTDFGIAGFAGREGAGLGQFESPMDVATDSDGNIYVADSGNSRLVKLNKNGRWMKSVGITPSPTSIAQSAARLYSVDGQDHIFVYDKNLAQIDALVIAGQSLESISAGSNLLAVSPTGVDARDTIGDFITHFPNQPGVKATAGLFLPNTDGTSAVLIDHASGSIIRVDVTSDRSGTSPLDVWQQLLNLLQAGRAQDVQQAKLLITPTLQQRLGDLSDSNQRESVVDWLKQYHDFHLYIRNERTAYYDATIGAIQDTVSVVFARVALSGQWQLAGI
ncbi:MAG: hypothetical protein HY287_03865 [Planctomycetes bacterium]|nr:hypothetical protein [Planctomycetota bacterium]MBI3833449.1 hypothetical protein [Planctomycetota bacterium]